MATLSINPISTSNLQKCVFIMNALESGWKVKKRRGSYIFTRKHEGRKEIIKDGYLETFLKETMNASILNMS
jgi:hypothetical protein